VKILRTARASLALRSEGPHQSPQKRSLALVSILQSLSAVEIANALHLRDFRCPAIFEFFNTIRLKADAFGRMCLHCDQADGAPPMPERHRGAPASGTICTCRPAAQPPSGVRYPTQELGYGHGRRPFVSDMRHRRWLDHCRTSDNRHLWSMNNPTRARVPRLR